MVMVVVPVGLASGEICVICGTVEGNAGVVDDSGVSRTLFDKQRGAGHTRDTFRTTANADDVTAAVGRACILVAVIVAIARCRG